MKLVKILSILLLAGCTSPAVQCVKSPMNGEIESLGLIIEAECSNCDIMEKYLTGSTVMTRLVSGEFPDSIDSVIQQGRQYHAYQAEQYCYNQVSMDIAKWLIRGYLKPEPVLYMWRNNQPKPKWVKEVKFKMKYHNFGI